MYKTFTILIITAALTVAGCASTDKTGKTALPASTTTETSAATMTSPEAADTVDNPEVAGIGSGVGFTWKNGLKAGVLSAKRFKISDTASGGQPGQIGVIVTVKVVNESKERIDLTLATVNLRAGEDSTETEQVIDVERGIELGFTGSVAPGRSATAKYGFAVSPTDLGKIDVEVTPGWEYDSATFTGRVS